MEIESREVGNMYAIEKKDLILRDLLALDRTILANERTLLAWIRTALSIIVAGVGFIKFFEIRLISAIGYGLLPLGGVIFAVGVLRFIKLQSELFRIKN